MKHLIMGTAGHVDHGKTSLIKALTGIDCDTHKEEKQRGITINLGFAYLNLPGGDTLGIIDVPGHKDFINTMVGGACGIDFVMLVIAADSGIMPQTVEHMNIINSLGVRNGIVALTKADLVDDELVEIAMLEIHEFLEKTSLENSPIIAVSSVTGKGIDELKIAIENIIPLIEEKKSREFFRMYIDRIFTVKGFGSVVTGSVMNGSIAVDQEVFLLPGNPQKLRVRSIERHGKTVDKVVAGDRAAINLIGLNTEDFRRGMIISDRNLNSTSMFDASITLFGNDASLPLWSQVTFHTGTFESPARLHNLNIENNQLGQSILTQIHLVRPAILQNNDKFIIRNSSGDITLGGGVVLDVSPLHHKKRTTVLYDSLHSLSETLVKGGSISELVRIELTKEFRPVPAREMAEKLHLPVEELKNEIITDHRGFSFYTSGDTLILFDANFENIYTNRVLKLLSDYHKEFPLFATGYDTNELAGKVNLSKEKTDKIYLNLLLQKMEERSMIERHLNTWILKGHTPTIDAKTKEETGWLEKTILGYGAQLPVLADIEQQATGQKIPKHKVKTYLSFLMKENRVLSYQNELVHVSLVNQYRSVLLSLPANSETGIPINDFKERINATKRFCAVLIGIFENEKTIKTQGSGVDTKIFITASGKNMK